MPVKTRRAGRFMQLARPVRVFVPLAEAGLGGLSPSVPSRQLAWPGPAALRWRELYARKSRLPIGICPIARRPVLLSRPGSRRSLLAICLRLRAVLRLASCSLARSALLIRLFPLRPDAGQALTAAGACGQAAAAPSLGPVAAVRRGHTRRACRACR